LLTVGLKKVYNNDSYIRMSGGGKPPALQYGCIDKKEKGDCRMGIVFDIQRCCYNDGPGLRTTVFLKGCQLRCAWCHNPESFRKAPQLRFFSRKCVACGRCVDVCPQKVHSIRDGGHQLDFSRCTACGECLKSCPAGALEILGKEMTAQEVMATVLRDRAYYDMSGGGVTFSGGEPTFQPEFLLELLKLSKEAGLHACLETNGYIPKSILEPLTGLVDLFLLDYKITDPSALQSYTGASGDLWNCTLEKLQKADKAVILRLPVIPGVNDTEDHFREAARLKQTHSCIREVQIMAYHSIGADKWEQLGYDYRFSGLPGATAEQKKLWEEQLALQLGPAV